MNTINLKAVRFTRKFFLDLAVEYRALKHRIEQDKEINELLANGEDARAVKLSAELWDGLCMNNRRKQLINAYSMYKYLRGKRCLQ